MTIREKLQNLDWTDSVEHLVALAYIAGQEEATKNICDEHNRRMTIMREAADRCRYRFMAHAILNAPKTNSRTGHGWNGDDTIYSPNYAGDVTEVLCANEWPKKAI